MLYNIYCTGIRKQYMLPLALTVLEISRHFWAAYNLFYKPKLLSQLNVFFIFFTSDKKTCTSVLDSHIPDLIIKTPYAGKKESKTYNS